MPRHRLLIVSIMIVLVFGSAGLAVAGGRHGGSGDLRADRPAPVRTGKHRALHPWPARTVSPTVSPEPGESLPANGEVSTEQPSADPGTGEPSAPQPSAPAKGSWWRPAVGTTWQWQLTGKLDLSVDAQVFDVDLFDVSASDVAAIHTKGAKAVCYVETGAWEDYRPDASDYPSSVLGKTVDGYSHERYVDIRQLDVLRPILDARLDLCAQKGFDGVEPDIDASYIDVGASGIGFPVSYADQVAFNQMVAADAHARGLAIGLKNGVDSDRGAQFVKDMEPSVDYAVNEECVAFEECEMLAVFPDNGKPVFHAEYLGGYRLASTGDYNQALRSFCPVTRPFRFSSILKDANESLSAWRQACS
jgi:hypothetical protein